MADGHVETFLTPVLETSVVAPMCQRETGETEGGGWKTKAQHEGEEGLGRKDIPTPALETSVVVPVCQRETRQTECIRGEVEAQKGNEDKKVNHHKRRHSSTPILEASEESCSKNIMTQEKESGDNKAKFKCNKYNEEVKQSTMVHNEEQANRMNSKCVL